ncbi:MAG: serine/threonine protein kinase [Candidatus Xenobia bacterium]
MLQEGGMSIVYAARDTRLNALLAVKEMKAHPWMGDDERARMVYQFEQEAHMLAALSHRGLPKVTDYFHDGGASYLVMEIIDGHSLQAISDHYAKPIPEPLMLIWAYEICQVLDYLHTRQPPIIFRDLKPSNVMINHDGHVKLIDFGISKHHEEGQATRTVIKGAGTPGYAPPEQYGTAGKQRTDTRSDIYSVGATLYALFTMAAPPEVTERYMDDLTLLHAREVNQALSRQLDELICQMLKLDPNERPSSVRDIMQVLYTLLGGPPPVDPIELPAEMLVPAHPVLEETATCVLENSTATSVEPPHHKAQQELAPPQPPQPPPPPRAHTEPARYPGQASFLPSDTHQLTATPRRRLRPWPLLLLAGLSVMGVLAMTLSHHSPAASRSPAPPAVAPTPVTRLMTVVTSPPETQVECDGQSSRVTAADGTLQLSLPVGQHRLSFHKAGFLTRRIACEVPTSGDLPAVVVHLQSLPVLVLDPAPQHVSFTVRTAEGRVVGQGVTPSRLVLAPGSYQVVLATPGYQPEKLSQVQLKAGKTVHETPRLRAIPPPSVSSPPPLPVWHRPAPPPPPPAVPHPHATFY